MNKSHKILIVAFIVTLVTLLGLLFLSFNSTIHHQKNMNYIFGERDKAILFSKLRDTASKRAIAIHKMALAEDAFLRDQYFQTFILEGNEGIRLRNLIVQKYASSDILQTLDTLKPYFAKAKAANEEVIDLIQLGELNSAKGLLFSDVQRLQQELNQKITEIIEMQNDLIDEHIRHNAGHLQLSRYLQFFFFIAFLVVAFLLQHTIRRVLRSENKIAQQGKRLRSLYEITSLSMESFDEQVRRTLALGCDILGLDAGKVAKIDCHDETNQVEYLVFEDKQIDVREGDTLPLANTFCDIPYCSETPIAIHHASKSEYRNHPGYHRSTMETYIAVPIWVNNEKYGTVSFSGIMPREPFDETEVDIVKLISQWVSVNLERERSRLTELDKQKADAANKAKSEFLAHMSHEIRTPLTAIIGFADASLDVEQSASERIAALRTIASSSKHLNSIINDILDVSKIEAGKLQIENIECNLPTLLHEVKELMSYQAKLKGLDFTIEYNYPYPASIVSDPVRIKQILLNLCGNAIKFTASGFVKIRTSFDNDNESILFEVLDTGIGMSDDELGRIFNAFAQANASTTRKYGGTGLGLSLSRQLAQLLCGDITVTSTSGVGSCFNFTIKSVLKEDSKLINNEKELESLNATKSKRPVFDNKYKGTVLIVDDTVENQQLFQIYLKRLGVDVLLASNGKEALSQLNRHQPDLILMDMQMPVMSGDEAVQKIRAKGVNIPILTITADVMPHHIEKYQAIGCNGFIAKPIKVELFYQSVTQYLTIENEIQEDKAEPINSELLSREPELLDVVYFFVDGLPAQLEEILASLDTKEHKKAKPQLHALKGTAANMGYPQLEDIAKKMEFVLLTGNNEDLNKLRRQLVSTCERIYKGFENKPGQDASSA